MVEDSVYTAKVLEHWCRPYHRGPCPNRTCARQEDNGACGDTVRVEAHIDDSGVLRQIYFSGEGCCLSQAAASMLAERLEGRTAAEVQYLSEAEMFGWFGAPPPPNRRECVLLPWRALKALAAASEAARTLSAPPPGGPRASRAS